MTQTAPSPLTSIEASEQSAASPIDMEHLLHYTMGDEGLAQEVLGLFCTQGRLYLEQLSAASTPQERKNMAHTLKGSAQGVGAHHVATLARDLEALSSSANEAAWDGALTALKAAFTDADRFISSRS